MPEWQAIRLFWPESVVLTGRVLDGDFYIRIFAFMNITSQRRPPAQLLAEPAAAPLAEPLLAKAAAAAEFLRSLAQEHRLAILCALDEGPRNVGELAALLGLAQPNVSQHLARLKAQGLVVATRSGTTLHYRATSGTARAIVAALQAEFCPQSTDRPID